MAVKEHFVALLGDAEVDWLTKVQILKFFLKTGITGIPVNKLKIVLLRAKIELAEVEATAQQ